MSSRHFTSTMTCAALLLGPAFSARAEAPPETAQVHFDAGRAHVREGRCDLAVHDFEDSVRASPNVGAWLNLGECQESLGHAQDAYDALRAAESLALLRGDPRSSVAHAALGRLESKSVKVVIDVPAEEGSDVEITIDDATLGKSSTRTRVLAPDVAHAIAARTQDRRSFARTIQAHAGETVVVAVAFPPSAGPSRGLEPEPVAAPAVRSSATSPLRSVGYVTAGVGVAALVAGGVFGALTLGARSDLSRAVSGDARCSGGYPSGVCDRSARADLQPLEDRAYGRATAATVLLVGGAVLVAAGLALVMLTPASASRAAARSTGEVRW